MGILDKFSKKTGADKPASSENVKGPGATLKDHGIDPSGLKFSFNQDGSVTVSGHAKDQSEIDRICQVIGEIPHVSNVVSNMRVAGTVAAAEAEPAAPVGEIQQRTYTVKPGDTLWAIAAELYGSGASYMKIFEANTSILENPDKIHPGQVLVIPDLKQARDAQDSVGE